MFPSLVNCCTIDWFEKWPEDALLSVAQNTLSKIGESDLIDNLSNICVIVHKVCQLIFNENFTNHQKNCRVLKI